TRLTLAEAPGETKLLEVRLEGARLEAGFRLALVVAAGRDVVRRVGVEEGREHLDLAAAGAELELAATVEGDALLPAALVELEQPLDRAEARRLAVEAPRPERQRFDIGPRMNRRVPRDPVAMRLERLLGLGREGGVLDPRIRERLGDAAVELGVRRVVDGCPRVAALEVEDVDDVAHRELVDEAVRPLGGGIELEPELRVELEPRRQRRLVHRGDEADRLRPALERVCDVDAVCLERVVERGRLERPAPVVAVRRLPGLAGPEEVGLVEWP